MDNVCSGCVHSQVCNIEDPGDKCSHRMSLRANGRELAGIIGLAMNTFTFDSKGFVEDMCTEHRTIQQSFLREVVMPYIRALSKSTYWDDRNESTVTLAKAIMERTTDEERRLPYI